MRGTRARRGTAAALALLLLAGAAWGESPTSEPEGWSYALFRELMSPYCPGRALADCPSGQADTLRMWVLVQESSGRSRADVEADLYERFGDVLRMAPRASGFGLAAYVIPIVAAIAGGGTLVIFLRRQTRDAAQAPAPRPIDPDLERRIDEELAG